MARPPNIDPIGAAGIAAGAFADAKSGTADPTLIKLAEGLNYLAMAVAVIAERQGYTNKGIVDLIKRGRESGEASK